MAKSHSAETQFVVGSGWHKSKGSKICILTTYLNFKGVGAILLSVEH